MYINSKKIQWKILSRTQSDENPNIRLIFMITSSHKDLSITIYMNLHIFQKSWEVLSNAQFPQTLDYRES